MKNSIIILFLCASIGTYSQSCSYSGGSCLGGLQDATPLAKRAVSDICRVLGINYISVYQSNVENACATRYSGTRVITYGANFLNYLYLQDSWGPVSVLAHEVGHHLNEDITWYGQFKHPWSKELRADYVSGYALYKLGASLSNAQSAFRANFSWLGTSSHPDTPKRMLALKQGWLRASRGY